MIWRTVAEGSASSANVLATWSSWQYSREPSSRMPVADRYPHRISKNPITCSSAFPPSAGRCGSGLPPPRRRLRVAVARAPRDHPEEKRPRPSPAGIPHRSRRGTAGAGGALRRPPSGVALTGRPLYRPPAGALRSLRHDQNRGGGPREGSVAIPRHIEVVVGRRPRGRGGPDLVEEPRAGRSRVHGAVRCAMGARRSGRRPTLRRCGARPGAGPGKVRRLRGRVPARARATGFGWLGGSRDLIFGEL